MPQNNIIGIKKPEAFVEDPITEVLRNGAKKLLSEALEAEIESFLRQYKDLKDSKGRQRITGYLPEREIQTGIGPVSVKVPRARDREPDNASDPLHFRSSIVPPYLRKTRSMEELIPWLYLKSIGEKERDQWQGRDLSQKQYVYIRADGIYCNVRMDDRQCLLVIIGATEDGKKELLALDSGLRESDLSWTEVLLDLKHRETGRWGWSAGVLESP